MLSWIGTRDVNQLIARGNYAKAIKLLESQLREDPKSVHLRQLLADVLVRDGQKRRAIEILEGLIQEFAHDGFLTKAIAVVKKVQRIDPEQSDAEEMLTTLVQMKQKSTAPPPPPRRPPRPDGVELPPALAADPEPPRPTAPSQRRAEFKTSTMVLSEFWFEDAAERRTDFNWSPLFRDFSTKELAALVGGLRLLVKQPGSIIFSEGEPGDSLFVLANGVVRVYQRDTTGHNDQVEVLQEGEVFGIPSVLSGSARTATITAISECELLELGKSTFEDIVETFPRIRDLVEELHESRTV